MRARLAWALLVAAIFSFRSPAGAVSSRVAPSAAECASVATLHLDRQANPNAARIVAACRGVRQAYDSVSAGVAPPARRAAAAAPTAAEAFESLGGSDLNLVTGIETYPSITQGGSMVWGSGSDIVAVYNDTRDALGSYSGISVSTDGGANFARLDPNPFAAVFGPGGGDFGSPAVAYDASAGVWLAATLAAGCGGQGIGLMSSATPADAGSWTMESCPHSGTADDRPILWIDNHLSSPFYGRRYIAFNDFAAGGALEVLSYAGGVWTPATVDATFIRNVHLTGSSGADGALFLFGMDEGGGGGNARTNKVYRSTNGGANWTSFAAGNAYPAAGAGLCAASDYFFMIPPVWRHMGWGEGAVGPGGVVHYVYSGAGQVPSSEDLGDIYYIRSTDNGQTWSAAAVLNTDQNGKINAPQWQPSISVTSQGYVLATWYDRRNTTDGLDYQYYGRLSLDNGASFLPDAPVSDLIVPQPTQVDPDLDYCFAGDSNLHSPLDNDSLVTWTDGRNAIVEGPDPSPMVQQMDVYFDRVPLCPAIAVGPPTLPDGEVTVTYNATLTATGGTVPYTFELSGLLPDGLGLTDDEIAGTPTVAGIFPFAIVATDALGCTGSWSYSVVVNPTGCAAITLTPGPLPGGTQGAPYTAAVVAAGAAGPFTYTITAGALPQGVTLDATTGEISGTPVESGNYFLRVTATDGPTICAGSQTYTLAIACPAIALGPESQLPDAFVGIPFLTNIVANGGTAPYAFEIDTGTLHSGVFMGEGGTIYGVTEQPGTKNFRVIATDANGCTGERLFRSDSRTCFPGAILCDGMSDILVNFTSADVCGAGAEWYGTGACPSSDDIGHSTSAHARWGVNGACHDYGAVATQDTLATDVLDVTQCNAGAVFLRFNYLLSFEDEPEFDRARVEVVADGAPVQVVADNGAGGPACSGTASPGLRNLRSWSGWQHLDLEIPAETSFQATFIGETDDGDNNAGEGFLVDDVIVQCKCRDDHLMTPEVLPVAVVNSAYSVTFVTENGVPPYTYETLPGHPTPPGLLLDPLTGILSGIPTTPGVFEFSVVSIDSNFCKLTVLYHLIVSPEGCPVITFTPEGDTLAIGEEDTFYSQLVTASGGTEPYIYSITAGDLPPGLAIHPDLGAVSGTPETPGVYVFTVSVLAADFCVGSHEYVIIINPVGCPAIDITPLVLPNAVGGTAYSQQLEAAGGEAPYAWSISAGALPDGIDLDPGTGEIAGTPTADDVFSFAVVAEDQNGCHGTASYGIVVRSPRIFCDSFDRGDTAQWPDGVGLCSIFHDGFETADTSRWSSAAP